MADINRYSAIIEKIFFAKYREGATEITFAREDLIRAAEELAIPVPKNLGDTIYSFRYRATLPESVQKKAPAGKVWVIRPAGRALYQFAAITEQPITPNDMQAETKVADSTPGIVSMYAFNDEQGLLAKIRYNRLIDIFTGVTCYSLQNHLRTTVPEIGQVETDEIYVGVDTRGAHYIFPVQAKGGTDKLNIVQIEQDYALCDHKFPDLICRPVAAQFITDGLIALFLFEESTDGLRIASEKHYRLVPPKELSPEELNTYKERPLVA
jgi:hypothetical protein